MESCSKYSEIETLYKHFIEWSEEELNQKRLAVNDLVEPYQRFCTAALNLSKYVNTPKTVAISVKLQVTDEESTDFINKKLIKNTQLRGSHNYHVTLGVIENVLNPCSKIMAIELKNHLHKKYPNFLKYLNLMQNLQILLNYWDWRFTRETVFHFSQRIMLFFNVSMRHWFRF